MDKGLSDYFEHIRGEFSSLSLEDFTTKVKNEGHKLSFWPIVSGTPLQNDWTPTDDAKNVAANENFPISLRKPSYEKFKYKIDEIIAKIKNGSAYIAKKRIAEDVVNLVSDAKIKAICIELNNTRDENILSLTSSLGECLKWTLWYRAKQIGTDLKEGGELKPLLNKAIAKNFYKDNATKRFLKVFRDNFIKEGYDMVRHSENYIPDLVIVNPAIDALEQVLRTTFSKQAPEST